MEETITEEYKYLSDPGYIGPGLWYVIHDTGITANSTEEMLDFCKFMRKLCERHRCPNCQKHCSEYIKINPPENCLNFSFKINGVRYKLGMFYWGWEFHNSVNKRLGKKELTLEEAFILFNERKDCNIMCRIDESLKSRK
jgi:hypothetical protein